MKTLDQLIEEEMSMAVERVLRHCQRVALLAFETRFQVSMQRTSAEPSPITPPRPPKKTKTSALPRRNSEEISALSSRLLEVVRADPGQPMSVLAPRLGVQAAALQVPVARLKSAKQLKTVGQRNFTRYFPVAQERAA